MTKNVYLAGPECFMAGDDEERYGDVWRMCHVKGLRAVIPLQNETLPSLPPHEQGRWIAQQCKSIISECDVVLANVSPFRSVSADVGTCVEIGIAAALGKPIFAWSNDLRCIADKINPKTKLNGTLVDDRGNWIEEFDMPDNCMIHGLVDGCFESAKEAIDAMAKSLKLKERAV